MSTLSRSSEDSCPRPEMTMTATRSAHDPKRASAAPRFGTIAKGQGGKSSGQVSQNARPVVFFLLSLLRKFTKVEKRGRDSHRGFLDQKSCLAGPNQHTNVRHWSDGNHWHEWGSAASRARRKEMINPRLRMEQTGKGDRPEVGATRDRREGAGSRESPEQVCRLPLSSLHRPRPFGRTERDRQRQTADRQT